jgi:hypothetical protein
MRVSSLAVWLLLAVAILAILLSRLSRSLGPLGIVASVILLIAVVGVAREYMRYRSRRSGLERSAAAVKNVTPHEPAISPGTTTSAGTPAAPAPSIVVIDPPDESERLASKLQALDRLRTEGLVTDEEYEEKRSRLIAEF